MLLVRDFLLHQFKEGAVIPLLSRSLALAVVGTLQAYVVPTRVLLPFFSTHLIWTVVLGGVYMENP
jgi:hypothetical protein